MQIKATPKAGVQFSGLTHDRFKRGGAILLVIFLITVIEHLTAATSGREGPL